VLERVGIEAFSTVMEWALLSTSFNATYLPTTSTYSYCLLLTYLC